MTAPLLALLLAACQPVSLEPRPSLDDTALDSGPQPTHTHGAPGILTATTDVLRLGSGADGTARFGPNGRWMSAWRDGDQLLGAVHDLQGTRLAEITPELADSSPGAPHLSWSGLEWLYATSSDVAPRTQAYDVDGEPAADPVSLLLPTEEVPSSIALDTDTNFEGHLIWSTGSAVRHGRFAWPADTVQAVTEKTPSLSGAVFGAPVIRAGADHYVAVWFESNDSAYSLWSQRIGFDGQVLSAPLQVAHGTEPHVAARPRVAVDLSGRFAVSWRSPTGVWMRIIGWDDLPLTTAIPLDPTGTGRDVAVALHHDNLVAVWTEEVDGIRSVYAQTWLLTMGLAITEPVVLAAGPATGVEIDLTDVDHEGYGVITWSDGMDAWAQPFSVTHGS